MSIIVFLSLLNIVTSSSIPHNGSQKYHEDRNVRSITKKPRSMDLLFSTLWIEDYDYYHDDFDKTTKSKKTTEKSTIDDYYYTFDYLDTTTNGKKTTRNHKEKTSDDDYYSFDYFDTTINGKKTTRNHNEKTDDDDNPFDYFDTTINGEKTSKHHEKSTTTKDNPFDYFDTTIKDQKTTLDHEQKTTNEDNPFDKSTSSEDKSNFDCRYRWVHCRDIIEAMGDQQNCDASWAFVFASMFSSVICITTKGTVKVHISEQDILECTDPRSFGCMGNFFQNSNWFCSKHGVVTRPCKPIDIPNTTRDRSPNCRHRCTNTSYELPYNQDKYFCKYVYKPFIRKVEEVQEHIREFGPVVTNITVYEDFFTHDWNTVYQHFGEDKVLKHQGAMIIGWGTEFGVPYWLMIHSDKKSFGRNGYIKIRRGTNVANVEHKIIAAFLENDIERRPGWMSKVSSGAQDSENFSFLLQLTFVVATLLKRDCKNI